MPNWTENTLIGRKEFLMQFISKDEDGNYLFDFNKLIPMPKELNLTSGGNENEAVVAYYLSLNKQQRKALKEELSHKEVDFYKNYNNAYLKKCDIEHIRRRNPDGFTDEQISLGEKYISNIRKYGYSQWYDWCCANWGTKWNSCYTSFGPCYVDDPEKFGVSFSTAWNAPFGIIEKFAELCKDDEFHWEYQNEDPDPYTTHILTKVNGKIVETLEDDEEAMEEEFDE